ncbi:MAG: hypothetical protein ACI9TV_000005 [Sulfurimonas sp.]|jgi:hypothetical protein|uniref:hypothetical protein n=1 Tax=Sulfurimonas sp. TaxID=2022749 RepID=UPI0039E60D8E
MSKQHVKKIEKIFEHPVATNVDTNKLMSALEHFGCGVEHSKTNKIKISFDGRDIVLGFHHSGSLSKDEVLKLRHFLEEIGLTPDRIHNF